MGSSWLATLALVFIVATSGYSGYTTHPMSRYRRNLPDKPGVASSDKKVQLLEAQLENAHEIYKQCITNMQDLTTKLNVASEKEESLTQKEQLLNNTLETLSRENEDLKRQLQQKGDKLQTLGRKLNETLAKQEKSISPELYLNNTLNDYYNDKNWRELRLGLEAQLDGSSEAYHQLRTIAYGHGYPLWKIGSSCMYDLAEVLVSGALGANIAESDNDTILHGASEGGCVRLGQMLLDRGADIEARDNGGATPLIIASRYGRLDMVQMLKERGADVNATNFIHESALHLAAQGGHLDVVKILVEAGARVSALDDECHTPLFRARSRGRKTVVEYLSEVDGGQESTSGENCRGQASGVQFRSSPFFRPRIIRDVSFLQPGRPSQPV